MVRDAVAAGSLARRSIRSVTARAAATIVLSAAALAGCGGSEPKHREQANVRFPVPLTVSNCDTWRHASGDLRHGIVRALRGFAGGPVGNNGLRGRVLDDDYAYKLLEGWCQRPYARNFRLYRLYTRAASLIGH